MKRLSVVGLVVAFCMVFSVAAFAADDTGAATLTTEVLSPYVEWVWDDANGYNLINASLGLDNVYLFSQEFKVRSTTSYSISAEITADWPGVVMDDSNAAVAHRDEHDAAFDIAATFRNYEKWLQFDKPIVNKWTGWINNARSHYGFLARSINTLGTPDNEVVHSLGVALVLVDDVAYKGVSTGAPGDDSTPTAGTMGKRRFAELPAGTYTADVVVTVKQNPMY